LVCFAQDIQGPPDNARATKSFSLRGLRVIDAGSSASIGASFSGEPHRQPKRPTFMRLLILEPHATGHHASYVRWLLRAVEKRKWSMVLATTAEAMRHPAMNSIPADYNNVVIHYMKDPGNLGGGPSRILNLIKGEWKYWKLFNVTVKDICGKMRIDGIVLPYLDYCFYALAIRGSAFEGISWCGISMRLGMTQLSGTKAAVLPPKWRLAKRILEQRDLKSLFVINPSICDVPRNWFPNEVLVKLRYLPDPAESLIVKSRQDARQILGIAPSQVAILVFGFIDERKGIEQLIASINADPGLDDFVVILAGMQSSDVRTSLQGTPYALVRQKRQLIEIDRVVDDAETGLVLAAADVMWVGYRNHQYMSGVLVLAGRAGLAVVGADEGEIGNLISKRELGVAFRFGKQAEVIAALHKLRDPRLRMEMGIRAQAFFAAHTADNFGEQVLHGLA
jgi:glycosyltransferase involved in cell wall biosynthesis